MTDLATQIAKEAKSLQQGLKEFLKTRDISDREVDIQRKNLRRQYLRLLFVHPYARESKDAETHLWMQTSYSLISIYKQRITALDRAIHHPPRQGTQHQQQPSRAVEYRRLLQRFRQFLSEEEKFWTQLILRFRRHFALDEAQPALTILGIVPEDEPVPSADGPPRRNQYQFPPESEPDNPAVIVVTHMDQTQRESRVAIISKALVCLGDIARYKELYNEAGGRPRAGHEDGPPATASSGRNGRGRRGGGPAQGSGFMALPRLRNYDRAQSCYEQARLLLPFDGNPSHQLAILSSYQKDIFGSLVHYYRALCVRTPYETASENLGTVLSKALEQYKVNGLIREKEERAEVAKGTPATPRLRVEAFKEKVVVLHSMWGMHIDEAQLMGEKVVKDFAGLVADRILPIDMISKVVILVQGALWKHRMLRRPASGEKRSARLTTTESQIVTHLVATHRVLLQNGSVELTEAPPEDAAEHDLAQRITATFRRTLPALRMSGKWLRSNTRYLSQGRKAVSGQTDDVIGTKDVSRGKDKRNAVASPIVVGDIQAFWSEYARFCNTLIHAFPMDQIPELKTQLEEDIELAGFLPLRKYMYGSDGRPPGSKRPSTDSNEDGDVSGHSRHTSEERTARDQVHPNEEQLMRISDILVDAEAVAEDENTPIMFERGSFLTKLSDLTGFRHSTPPDSSNYLSTVNQYPEGSVAAHEYPSYLPPKSETEDDDNISLTTRTEDDIVGEVMRIALRSDNEGDENEDDEIVWQPSPPLSPQQDPIFTALPTTPPRMNPRGTGPGVNPRRIGQMDQERSPPTATPLAVPPTTAEDLLNNVMSVTRSPASAQHARGSSLPPVSMLFGSNGLGNSIWSPAATSSPSHYPRGNLSFDNSLPYVPQVPQPPRQALQSPIAPSQPWQSGITTANTHPGYVHESLGSPYAPQQPLRHQRAPSASMAPLRQTMAPTLPVQRNDIALNPSLYGSQPLHDPLKFADVGVPGHRAPGDYSGVSYNLPGGNALYRQAQPEYYNVGPSPPQLREQGLHTRFPTSSVPNIWSSNG
ncbi:hypothetical protein BDW22DRAFT_1429283 [Trametopsis cervina]|nr:hypothetical protein BDW22DRAFT_1429283 [Trametopsis cervina]